MELIFESTRIDECEALITSDVSPYRLTSVCEVLSGKMVRPQVIYSYVRQGFIVAHKNELGKWVVKKDDAIAFALKYSKNNGLREFVDVKEDDDTK